MVTEKELDLKLQQAQVYRKAKKYEKACVIFSELLHHMPDALGLLLLLGNCYVGLKQWDKAEALFRKTISLYPDSEAASLALFHCLWDNDKPVEALDEMKRFLPTHESEDYSDILHEISQD